MVSNQTSQPSETASGVLGNWSGSCPKNGESNGTTGVHFLSVQGIFWCHVFVTQPMRKYGTPNLCMISCFGVSHLTNGVFCTYGEHKEAMTVFQEVLGLPACLASGIVRPHSRDCNVRSIEKVLQLIKWTMEDCGIWMPTNMSLVRHSQRVLCPLESQKVIAPLSSRRTAIGLGRTFPLALFTTS